MKEVVILVLVGAGIWLLFRAFDYFHEKQRRDTDSRRD